MEPRLSGRNKRVEGGSGGGGWWRGGGVEGGYLIKEGTSSN